MAIRSPPLPPQADFPCAISRHCTRPRVVSLQLHTSFWSHPHHLAHHAEPLEIRDSSTNLTMFRVPATLRATPQHSKRLLDMYNGPIAIMETSTEHSESSVESTILPSGTERCQSPVTCTVQLKTPVSIQATWSESMAAGATVSDYTITSEGDWLSRQCEFWLETAHSASEHDLPAHQNQTRFRIARIRRRECDTTLSSTSTRPLRYYVLEIAAGVDIALLLLLCAALDDATSPPPSYTTAKETPHRASRTTVTATTQLRYTANQSPSSQQLLLRASKPMSTKAIPIPA